MEKQDQKNTENTENPENPLDILKQQVAEFAKKQSAGGRKTRENILSKYFVPRETKELFRILPPKPGKKHIQEAFFHVVSLNGPGGKKMHGKVIYCPAHNNPKIPKKDEQGNVITDQDGKPVMIPEPCPLCDKYKKKLKTQDQSIKGIKKEDMTDDQLKINEKNKEIFTEANKWQAKKFYIVRGIDKGKQKDGVKFWRFKHNFRNQGTLDKLYPTLGEFMEVHNADFADPEKGCDLSITMAESEFNNRTYKAVSAISYRPPSKLHEDPIIARQWLNDDITWRDVFKPKRAPHVEPYEFLVMVAEGNDPYWDDSDPQNKKWRFPGRPDLEEKANDRTRNLDADDDEQEIEQASDISNDGVTIGNVTQNNVGTFKEDAVDVGGDVNKESSSTDTPQETEKKEEEEDSNDTTATNNQESEDNSDYGDDMGGDYDDLPF